MLQALARIEAARNTPFREIFKSFAGSDEIPTLSDEAIATAFHVAKTRETDPGKIAEKLPEAAREKFCEFRNLNCGRAFERFMLFSKAADDGILIGVGARTEIYFVLCAWDGEGADIWDPRSVL